MVSFVLTDRHMVPAIYEKLKHLVTQIVCQKKLGSTIPTPKGRPRKISEIRAITLALYRHASTRGTKVSVYRDFKEQLRCSYKTFVVAVNASILLALTILFRIMRMNRKHQHLVKYTDATDIPVCLKKNGDRHRTMAGFSGLGHSTKGWFFGLKMTMTRDADGRLLALRFDPPTANDRDIFRKVNRDIDGIIIADAGYVSKKLERDMYKEGKRWVLIRPYKTMKKLMTDWQEELYKGRFSIEFDFRSLKLFYGLVTSMPRSVNGYLANYIHALLSFVLR